ASIREAADFAAIRRGGRMRMTTKTFQTGFLQELTPSSTGRGKWLGAEAPSLVGRRHLIWRLGNPVLEAAITAVLRRGWNEATAAKPATRRPLRIGQREALPFGGK